MGRFGKKVIAKKKEEAETKAPKVLVKTEDDYEPVNRWWERTDGAESGKRGAKKWDTFEHHGLQFAPDYEPHGIPIKYDGKEIKLPVDAEEVATYWTSVKGTDYETKDVFIKNFWDAFQAKLTADLKEKITDLKKCDFSKIQAWREEERRKRNERSKEEKEAEKAKNDKETSWYAHGLVNGVREKLGNYRLEPPQLFRGRGEHPKQGMLKKRTWPENCIMNVGVDAPVPRPDGTPGHAWRDVVHENHVQWIAAFDDGVLGDLKYVSFAATSGLKGQPDMLKYDRARRLLQCVDAIRDNYQKLQKGKSLIDRQKATATYFIDRLALRVGGEKDLEDEADTVGCCSLRVEHLKLEDPNIIHFDFLGKDSIRYQNSVTVTPEVYENVGEFMKGKKGEQDVFDKVKPGVVNEYFKEFMEDLTAKVFRTYNASYTLQKELAKFDESRKDKFSQDDLVKFYNDANRQVAVLCNHQKAVSKTHEASMEKNQTAKDKMSKDLKTLKKHLASLQDSSKPGVKNPDGALKLPKDIVVCKKQIGALILRIEKHNASMQEKEDNKLVSLGTSKVNYMDPRITVAWCKKVDLSIERVFPRTVRTKFPWAMHFPSTYKFD
jgi:DNA topoisomerase-1